MRDPITQILDKVELDAVNVITMILSIHPSAIDLVLGCHGVIEAEIQNDDSNVDDQIPPERSQS